MTVRNVPVSIPTNALASLGLNIIEGGDPQVAVQVKGRVIQVGNLEPGDIQVTASFTEIVGAGTYDLKLTASTSAGTVVAIYRQIFRTPKPGHPKGRPPSPRRPSP